MLLRRVSSLARHTLLMTDEANTNKKLKPKNTMMLRLNALKLYKKKRINNYYYSKIINGT